MQPRDATSRNGARASSLQRGGGRLSATHVCTTVRLRQPTFPATGKRVNPDVFGDGRSHSSQNERAGVHGCAGESQGYSKGKKVPGVSRCMLLYHKLEDNRNQCLGPRMSRSGHGIAYGGLPARRGPGPQGGGPCVPQEGAAVWITQMSVADCSGLALEGPCAWLAHLC